MALCRKDRRRGRSGGEKGAAIGSFSDCLITEGVEVRQQTLFRAQELCESRGGRPELAPSLLIDLTVSVDVKQH